MSENITVKQESLLPMGFKIFGALMVMMGGAIGIIQIKLMINNFELKSILFMAIGIMIILGGLILITAHYRLTIDTNSKTYHVYPWLLGYQTGEPEKFNYIDKIYINEVKLKQNFHSQSGAVKTDHYYTYKAFIKFDDGEKIHLDTDTKQEKLALRVAQYKRQLKHVIGAA